mmetsp:Transcript_5040/g.12815  ORF Transcript_5040/g.12815 Transcript_5040/m.12815 type:complete len:144 (-) Transcript_5040:47-478(-)
MATKTAKEGVVAILGLYRQIMRAHYKQLPTPLRTLGDSYAREEFRRHLEGGKTTHSQWIAFGSEWSRYLSAIAPSAGAPLASFSGDLSPELMGSMTPEQQMQLQQLKEEALSFRAEHLQGGGKEEEEGPPEGGNGVQGGGGAK